MFLKFLYILNFSLKLFLISIKISIQSSIYIRFINFLGSDILIFFSRDIVTKCAYYTIVIGF